MTIDIENIKLFGTALALLISTVTVQFRLVEFINKKRDEHQNDKGAFIRFSEYYDWFWGYLLGLEANWIFLMIAYNLKTATRNTELSLFGISLFCLFLGNMLFWAIGLFIDAFRIIKYSGQKGIQQCPGPGI